MYINLHLSLLNFLFFICFLFFLSTYLLVSFSLLYSSIGTQLQFGFPVCSLISIFLVYIIFGFLCSQGQSILLNFCWTVLILFMVYMCIFSHTFYCYKPLALPWAFAVLQSFPFSFLLFYFFSLFYNFNFLNLLYFFLHLFLCLPILLFFSPCS